MRLLLVEAPGARPRDRFRQARQRSDGRSRPRASVLALSIESLEPEDDPFAERLRHFAHTPAERILGERANLRNAVPVEQPARLAARIEVRVVAVELAADRSGVAHRGRV